MVGLNVSNYLKVSDVCKQPLTIYDILYNYGLQLRYFHDLPILQLTQFAEQ